MAKDEVKNYITLESDDGDVQVEVIDQTIINGVTYLLVADIILDEEEEGDCYILKEISNKNSEIVNYEVVPNDEADGIFDTFEKMLSDEIELRK